MHRENWDDLRYVLAVAETGSVSGAARILAVNHATVLRRVAAFEQRCGVKMFDKSHQGYAIPPEKMRLLKAIREVEAAHQALDRLIRGGHAPLAGVVRVTSTDSLCAAFLPRVLSRIEAQGSALRFELLASNLPVDLGRLHADLTVRPAEVLGDELSGTEVGQMRFAHYRAPGRGTAAGAETWLGLTGALARSLVAGWMAAAIPPQRVRGGADSFLTLAEMTAAGLGQAILPCFLAEGDSRLERVEGVVPPLTVPVWVAVHADLMDVPRLAGARALLAAAMAEEAERLDGRLT